jgi:hypothetical protein
VVERLHSKLEALIPNPSATINQQSVRNVNNEVQELERRNCLIRPPQRPLITFMDITPSFLSHVIFIVVVTVCLFLRVFVGTACIINTYSIGL